MSLGIGATTGPQVENPDSIAAVATASEFESLS